MPKLTVLFAATTLFAGTCAAYFWQQLNAERALTAQLRERALQPGQQGQPGLQSAGQPVAAAVAQSDQPAATGVAPNAEGTLTAAAPPPPRAVAAAAGESRPTNEPVFITTNLKLNQLQERYPSVVKELGLTSAEAEALYDLLTKQQNEPSPVRALMAKGVPDEQELKRAQEELARSQNAEIAALLGPKAAQWQEYLPSVEARRRVNELTMMLASSSPMTEKQSAALVNNIYAEHRRRAQDESARSPPANDPRAQLEFEEENLKRRMESNRRTLDAARSFMNADQVALMTDTMARGNERIRVSLKTRRERLESGTARP